MFIVSKFTHNNVVKKVDDQQQRAFDLRLDRLIVGKEVLQPIKGVTTKELDINHQKVTLSATL